MPRVIRLTEPRPQTAATAGAPPSPAEAPPDTPQSQSALPAAEEVSLADASAEELRQELDRAWEDLAAARALLQHVVPEGVDIDAELGNVARKRDGSIVYVGDLTLEADSEEAAEEAEPETAMPESPVPQGDSTALRRIAERRWASTQPIPSPAARSRTTAVAQSELTADQIKRMKPDDVRRYYEEVHLPALLDGRIDE